MVLWRLRYKLSLRDLIRGFVFSYEAVRDSEAKTHAGPGRGSPPETKGQSRPKLVHRRDLYLGARPLEVSVCVRSIAMAPWLMSC